MAAVETSEGERAKVRLLKERAERMGGLKEAAGWQELRAELERRCQRDTKRLVTRYLRSGELVNQREIDYVRGFWAGAEWILDNPEMAEATFDRAMRRALAMTEVQGE